MIEINGLTFKYKKNAMEYVRDVLTILDGKTIDSDNAFFKFFQDLLSRHPEREIDNLESVQVIRNPAGHIAIDIKEKDSDYVSISWNKCITGNIAHYKNKVRMAMRSAVIDQIKEFKSSVDGFFCSICNSQIDKSDVHIDHENYFEVIAKEFEEISNKEFELENLRDHRGFQFVCEIDSLSWQEFHKKKAVLRVTCSKCNLTRK